MSQPVPVSPTIKPGRGWFVVAAAIIVLGLALGIGLIVKGATSLLPGLTAEVPTGSQQTVRLDRAGEWALYGASTDNAQPHGMRGCAVEGVDGGQVSTGSKAFDVSFTRGGHQWYWVDSITVSEPGEYLFRCREGGNINRYAVGDKPRGSGFAGVFGGIAVIGLALVAGAVTIIVTAVRRSSAARRLRESTAGQTYPPYRPL